MPLSPVECERIETAVNAGLPLQRTSEWVRDLTAYKAFAGDRVLFYSFTAESFDALWGQAQQIEAEILRKKQRAEKRNQAAAQVKKGQSKR